MICKMMRTIYVMYDVRSAVMSTQKASKRKYFSFWDLLPLGVVVCTFVLSLCLLFGLRSEGDLTAVVSLRGQVIKEIPLSEVSEPYEFTVEGEESVVISVSSQGVAFVSSQCPDKLCINTGVLTRAGESSVCLPARVSVKLVSEGGAYKDAPDAVAG